MHPINKIREFNHWLSDNYNYGCAKLYVSATAALGTAATSIVGLVNRHNAQEAMEPLPTEYGPKAKALAEEMGQWTENFTGDLSMEVVLVA